MKTQTRLLAAALGLGALLTGCKDSTSPRPVPATLGAGPSQIELTDAQLSGTLYLTTTPSRGQLEWQLVAKPDWIALNPTSGTVKGTTQVSVQATIPANAEPGTLGGTIELVSDGGTASIPVRLQVSPDPRAQTSAAAVTVPENNDTARFTLTNSGRGTLQWSLTASRPEVTVAPAQGFLGTGQSTEIRVVADKQPLPAGTTQATLTLASNQKAGNVALPVNVQVAAAPNAEPSLSRLGFAGDATQRSFWLHNTGKGTLTWQASAADPWVSASPASGQVGPADSVRVTVSVNRAAVGGTDGSSALTITSNSVGGTLTVPVVVTSGAGLAPGTLRVLDHDVVDAEYSARANLIVTVSANPSRLSLIDPFTGAVSHVPLPLPPTAVSIRPDGAFAAVGHNGQVSYVNLGTRTVVRTYAVTTDAIDVVLPQKGWVYVFPRTDQWESIRSVNLATGLESNGGGYSIYAGTVAKLHPSGDYMYGANRGLSPSDFEKYDIRSGVAQVLYDSPYHGDYAFSGDIWISEDGSRLFARSGNVFRSSAVKSQDMTYVGSFAGASGVRSAADSRASGRIFVLSDAASAVRVYDQAFLAFRGTAPLPQFTGLSGPVSGEGRFVFASADGERVYVLVESTSGAQWGIATYATSAMP
ncbi:MAG: BACON domain-containing protein [Longimicrobiaceae bacterium]